MWEIEVNRPAGRDRYDCRCLACRAVDAIEDERHILPKCPRYADVRYADLWASGVTSNALMKQAMGADNQKDLASIIHQMHSAG